MGVAREEGLGSTGGGERVVQEEVRGEQRRRRGR